MRGKLLPFIGKVIALIILMCVVWHFVAPAYNHSLVGVSDRFSLTRIFLSEDNATICFSIIRGGIPLTAWIYGSYLHYGLILVVALIAVSPGLKLSRRVKFILIALIIMFVIHVVAILIMANMMQSTANGPPSLHNNPAIILFLTVGCDLFPALVWGGLCFKYWWPKTEAVSATKARGHRNQIAI